MSDNFCPGCGLTVGDCDSAEPGSCDVARDMQEEVKRLRVLLAKIAGPERSDADTMLLLPAFLVRQLHEEARRVRKEQP